MPFRVYWKEDKRSTYMVYAVGESNEGKVQFLVYTLSGWDWVPAEEYTPVK
ncbi:hypothetical protein MKX72_20305 [Priestia sp. FSL R5-0597]|uniref:hypothetical protein n=1 Tax=Priestia sp. FSL R5-0597 TaxID=2921580 RepID=UPI0030F8BB83